MIVPIVAATVAGAVIANEVRSWRKPSTFALEGPAPTLIPDTWTTRGK